MKRNNKLYNFDEFLNEEFLDVSIGNIVVGSVDSGDDKTIKKISDISKGSKYKASIVNELKELNFPDSQANIIYNKLLSSSNIEGVLDYIKNKRVKLNSLLGKVTNASDINKLIGIKGEDSDDLFSYKWASSPPMGSGEAWLSLMIDGGRRPKGEKGDVIINNAEVEVKGDGARIIGQKGYGDGKQMRKSLERAVINISDKLNLNPPTDIIKRRSKDVDWNIGKTRGNALGECLLWFGSQRKLSKSDLSIIGKEIIEAYKTYLINLDTRTIGKEISSAISPKGELDLKAYNESLINIYFEYYLNIEGFNLLCITNRKKSKFLIIKPSEFMYWIRNGAIKIVSTPSFSNSAGPQGAAFAIAIK